MLTTLLALMATETSSGVISTALATATKLTGAPGPAARVGARRLGADLAHIDQIEAGDGAGDRAGAGDTERKR